MLCPLAEQGSRDAPKPENRNEEGHLHFDDENMDGTEPFTKLKSAYFTFALQELESALSAGSTSKGSCHSGPEDSQNSTLLDSSEDHPTNDEGSLVLQDQCAVCWVVR